MKGGGYTSATISIPSRSFQIYYRGLQAADLGQYHFYGTPYDMGFCKQIGRALHVLAVDPMRNSPARPPMTADALRPRLPHNSAAASFSAILWST